MTGRIGLGMSIDTAEEFNRRAAMALRGIDHGETFLGEMQVLIQRGGTLTGPQQTAFVRGVHRYRRRITDQLVRDYAEKNAREAD